MTPDNPLIENGRMELLTFEGTLTKRERFAMAAMQGLCANPEWEGWTYEQAATDAVMQADWLIFALNDRPPLKEGMHP